MSMQVEDPRVIEFDVRTDEMLVNMGPQHPSTHGVLRLLLRTDGEVVHEMTPHIGYLHRCAEKIGENLTPQWIPVHRPHGLPRGHEHEPRPGAGGRKAARDGSPRKGDDSAVIIAELNRIASHLVGMGAYGLDLGTFSPFLYAFREREIILDLFEEVCGARLTYSYITIGGATHDLPEKIIIPPGLAELTAHAQRSEMDWTDASRLFLDWLEKRIPEYHTLLTRNSIFIKRTAGLGRFVAARWRLLTAAPARCCAARASTSTCAATASRSTRGCTRATSSKFPWRRSTSAPPEVVLGDNWCRFFVRMLEVVQSIGLVRQALDRYPAAEGAYRVPFKMATKLPEDRSAISKPNAPAARWVSTSSATAKPNRYRAARKSSCFCNLSITARCARRPDRRHAGDRRLARHRDGRNRPMSEICTIIAWQVFGIYPKGIPCVESCFLFSALAVWHVGLTFGDDWPGWRGADRSDVSRETGLLKKWPEGEPSKFGIPPMRTWVFGLCRRRRQALYIGGLRRRGRPGLHGCEHRQNQMAGDNLQPGARKRLGRWTAGLPRWMATASTR